MVRDNIGTRMARAWSLAADDLAVMVDDFATDAVHTDYCTHLVSRLRELTWMPARRSLVYNVETSHADALAYLISDHGCSVLSLDRYRVCQPRRAPPPGDLCDRQTTGTSAPRGNTHPRTGK